MFITSLLGLLKGRQNVFVDKYAKLVLRESDDSDMTSQDDELNELGPGSMHFVGSMIQSNNIVDRRLISLFKMREEENNSPAKESKPPNPNQASQVLKQPQKIVSAGMPNRQNSLS